MDLHVIYSEYLYYLQAYAIKYIIEVMNDNWRKTVDVLVCMLLSTLI